MLKGIQKSDCECIESVQIHFISLGRTLHRRAVDRVPGTRSASAGGLVFSLRSVFLVAGWGVCHIHDEVDPRRRHLTGAYRPCTQVKGVSLALLNSENTREGQWSAGKGLGWTSMRYLMSTGCCCEESMVHDAKILRARIEMHSWKIR